MENQTIEQIITKKKIAIWINNKATLENFRKRMQEKDMKTTNFINYLLDAEKQKEKEENAFDGLQ
jgi:hypothetical protein